MALTKGVFKDNWADAMRQRRGREHWDRKHLTTRELEAKGYFPECATAIPFAEEVVRDCWVYEQNRKHVAQLNRLHREAIAFLGETEKRLVGMEKRFRQESHLPVALQMASRLQELSKLVGIHREGFQKNIDWRRALRTYPLTEDDWEDTLIAMPDIPGDPSESTVLAFKGHLAEKASRGESLPQPATLTRELDLDRRFQVRIAMILHRAYPGVSKMTIARLVVLVYICANLVEIKDGLRFPGSKHPLTVGAVYEKIKKLRFEQLKQPPRTE
jgi:hypothetical protein